MVSLERALETRQAKEQPWQVARHLRSTLMDDLLSLSLLPSPIEARVHAVKD